MNRSDAVARVAAFLAQRESMRGLDPEVIISANYAELRISDLRALVASEVSA